MPRKGTKPSPRARGAHPLEVRWRPKIKLAGPPAQEPAARRRLALAIAEWLRAGCPVRFGNTFQPEHWADRMVYGTGAVPGFAYTPWPKSVIRVAELDVDYKNQRKNSPGRWKVWIRVRDAEDLSLGHAGESPRLWK